jgi:hypothetical protein
LRTAEDATLIAGLLKAIGVIEDMAASFCISCPAGLHSCPLLLISVSQKFPGPEPWRLLVKMAICPHFHPLACEGLIRGVLAKASREFAVAAAREERMALARILAADAAALAVKTNAPGHAPLLAFSTASAQPSAVAAVAAAGGCTSATPERLAWAAPATTTAPASQPDVVPCPPHTPRAARAAATTAHAAPTPHAASSAHASA